jgi:hypothetical protein
MGGLHDLLHHGEQLLLHLRQIDLLAQRRAEGGQRLFRVVLLAIKAPINHALNAPPHGQKEGGNRQRGEHQHHWLLCCLAARHRVRQALQSENQPSIDGTQQGGQEAVDQHLVDQRVNLPEPKAQDGGGNGERDEAAVRAAFSSEVSNGQTEGQVLRLKLIKRSMFGRANFDLLRLRFLYRA